MCKINSTSIFTTRLHHEFAKWGIAPISTLGTYSCFGLDACIFTWCIREKYAPLGHLIHYRAIWKLHGLSFGSLLYTYVLTATSLQITRNSYVHTIAKKPPKMLLILGLAPSVTGKPRKSLILLHARVRERLFHRQLSLYNQ